jgi:hypothetical protein
MYPSLWTEIIQKSHFGKQLNQDNNRVLKHFVFKDVQMLFFFF